MGNKCVKLPSEKTNLNSTNFKFPKNGKLLVGEEEEEKEEDKKRNRRELKPPKERKNGRVHTGGRTCHAVRGGTAVPDSFLYIFRDLKNFVNQ